MYFIINCLILKSKIYGEYDKLVTLYSYEFGKIKVVVPSAKKNTAKLSYATEPLTKSELIIYTNNITLIAKVTGARIIENNTGIKVDFEKTIYALYTIEVIDKFTTFNFENNKKYILISRVWEILCICKYPKRVLMAFILRFLKLSGYNFYEYLKNNNVKIDKIIKENIKKLLNCSGNDIDYIFDESEDRKIWYYIDIYLSNYIKCFSLDMFLKKKY
ncbi:MAG: DNA repair protein RecO [Endomicrobium sp.]|jgi:DNA repair protein RecO (recombination protein O)|nr:DNA repair protein RecO [Endomicrobium sp.]